MGKSLTENNLRNSFYTFGLNILGKYKLNKHILKSHLMSKAVSRIARVVDRVLIQRGIMDLCWQSDVSAVFLVATFKSKKEQVKLVLIIYSI